MIDYIEIINKIKDIKINCLDDFNKYVSIPMTLSNLESKFRCDGDSIIIEKKDLSLELALNVRKAFSEIIYILKKIDLELYNKIDYKYIDYFEKFKSNNYIVEVEDFNQFEFDNLTLEILAVFNLKYWCTDYEDQKIFLDNLEEKTIDEEESNSIENEVVIEENNNEMIRVTWWTKLINIIRSILKK